MSDYKGKLIWAPVRHHSPICSWQLLRLIDENSPDVILIEAPANGQSLLSFLQHPATSAPIAVYFHASWTLGDFSFKERSYLPLADISPEWNAIRAAGSLNTPVEFIDIAYGQWDYLESLEVYKSWLEEQKNQEDLDDGDENEIDDDEIDEDEIDGDEIHSPTDEDVSANKTDEIGLDNLLYKEFNENQYISRLLENTHCDNFDIWWDRYIENETQQTADDFFKLLYTYGQNLRACRKEIDDHTRIREQYMASRIAPHLKQQKKVLVVCGAFHCDGIAEYLATKQTELDPNLEFKESQFELSGSHLIPYPLSRLHDISYGARFHRVGYYQKRWSYLKKSIKKPPKNLSQVLHAELANDFMMFLHKKSHPAAIPQMVDLVVNAEQLANIRGVSPGWKEFEEASLLTLEKDPVVSSQGSRFDLWLDQFFIDHRSGTLPDQLPLPALVADFQRRCQEFGLPLMASAGEKKKNLAIYRQEKHRELSQWLHKIAFLNVPYAEQTSGPNLLEQTDLDRVREGWSITWQVETQSTLVELSHLGTTIIDLVQIKLQEAYKDKTSSSQTKARLLLAALQMGMQDWIVSFVDLLKKEIEEEMLLSELRGTLILLLGCSMGSSILTYQIQQDFERLITSCYIRICARLPRALGNSQDPVKTELLAELMKVSRLHPHHCPSSYLLDAVDAFSLEYLSCELKGAALAVTLSLADINESLIVDALTQTSENLELEPDSLGDFYYGVWSVDVNLYYKSPILLTYLSETLLTFNEDDFLKILPGLRRAFMVMSPNEIRELPIAIDYLDDPILLSAPKEASLTQSKAIQDKAQQWLKQWGIET